MSYTALNVAARLIYGSGGFLSCQIRDWGREGQCHIRLRGAAFAVEVVFVDGDSMVRMHSALTNFSRVDMLGT